jgi:hypothetical protein
MLESLRIPAGWIAAAKCKSQVRLLECLVRGHQWDPAPRSDVPMLRCVRCGLTAEPVSGL